MGAGLTTGSRLSPRALNRTLLRRQHLLAHTTTTVLDEVRHLVGLQAQETLSPYLALSARLVDLDPAEVTRGLEDRSLIRFLTMRGTVHLLAGDDIGLRGWTAPVHEREIEVSQSIGAAREVDRAEFTAALEEVMADGPRPQKDIGLALAERFPHPPTALGQLARSVAPLVQLPPRGTWKGSGGVVYDDAARWTGRPVVPPAAEEVVTRYLRAFGPATAADVTAWSGVKHLAPVTAAMVEGGALVRHQDAAGKALLDVPDGVLAEADEPAPVRLLGRYDNVWLAHAGRDRVTSKEGRALWSGPNGGIACTVFADGYLVGLWRPSGVKGERVEVVETLRPLTRTERHELAEEVDRAERLLAR